MSLTAFNRARRMQQNEEMKPEYILKNKEEEISTVREKEENSDTNTRHRRRN